MTGYWNSASRPVYDEKTSWLVISSSRPKEIDLRFPITILSSRRKSSRHFVSTLNLPYKPLKSQGLSTPHSNTCYQIYMRFSGMAMYLKVIPWWILRNPPASWELADTAKRPRSSYNNESRQDIHDLRTGKENENKIMSKNWVKIYTCSFIMSILWCKKREKMVLHLCIFHEWFTIKTDQPTNVGC